MLRCVGCATPHHTTLRFTNPTPSVELPIRPWASPSLAPLLCGSEVICSRASLSRNLRQERASTISSLCQGVNDSFFNADKPLLTGAVLERTDGHRPKDSFPLYYSLSLFPLSTLSLSLSTTVFPKRNMSFGPPFHSLTASHQVQNIFFSSLFSP